MTTIDSKPSVFDTPLETAIEWYRMMALIRRFEQVAYRAYERGEIEGTIHVSIGQEAVAVGVMSALRGSDKVLSHHRGHGHALAKQVSPRNLMAELCGRSDGISKGKGGSMHATDVEHGFLGTLAVVGSSVPLSAGVAMAIQLKGLDDICTVFFGDGGVNQGVLYETFNLAALWSLSVLFVCENNSYAITTSTEKAIAGEGVAARAAAFGLASEIVDGQDVTAVAAAAKRLVAGARQGRPALLECLTYRFMGHSRGDPAHGVYRSKEELDAWQERDPIQLITVSAGLDQDLCSELDAEVKDTVQEALDFAMSSPRPDPSEVDQEVWG